MAYILIEQTHWAVLVAFHMYILFSSLCVISGLYIRVIYISIFTQVNITNPTSSLVKFDVLSCIII
jgi:hypothetical protein